MVEISYHRERRSPSGLVTSTSGFSRKLELPREVGVEKAWLGRDILSGAGCALCFESWMSLRIRESIRCEKFMRTTFFLLFAGAGWLASASLGLGQVEISVSDLAAEPGDSFEMVSNRGSISVAGFVGHAGGPQHWDFSEGPSDLEHTFRIVEISETGMARDFRQATYAEEQTRETEGSRALAFYRNLPGEGRQYFGFFDDSVAQASQQVVFDAPTIDLHLPLRFGDEWRRFVDFPSTVSGFDSPIPLEIKFDSIATVDAYGTMTLPHIGTVDVLRVNESNQYETSADFLGMAIPIENQFFQNYYWYAPKIGLVAEMVSDAATRPPSDPLDRAAHFFRLVGTSKKGMESPACVSVENLEISAVTGFLSFRWLPDPSATTFQILAADAIDGEWTEVAQVNSATFALALDGAMYRFYQVVKCSN